MLLALVLAAALQAPPAPAPDDPGLTRGLGLVTKGDAAAAVADLDEAVRRLSGTTRFDELARAHLYLGAAYVLLGQDKAARASFKEALRWSEYQRFPKGRVPPQVVAAFGQVLKETGRGAGPPPEMEMAPGTWYELPQADCCPEVFLPPGTRQLVVDASGGGDFRSLAAAIRSQPAVRILVRPGTYREALVLDRPVALVGDGPREAIVIEGVDQAVLTNATQFALAEGLTLRARGAGHHAVDVPRGTLFLSRCDLRSDSLAAVAAHDGGQARLKDCLVHDTAEGGLFASAGGTVADEGSLLRGCGWGANVRGGVLELEGTRVERSGKVGVLLEPGSRGTLENVDVSGSGQVNLQAAGSELTVRGGRLRDARFGALVIGQARATLEDLEITGHAAMGLGQDGGSSVTVRRGRVARNEQVGITVDGGELRLEEGRVEDDRVAGLVVRQGGTARVLRSQLLKNRGYGVLVFGGGQATVEGSTLSGNRAGSYKSEGGGQLTRVGNKD